MAPLRGFVVAALLLLQGACTWGLGPPAPFEYRQRHMGVEARIVLYAPDRAAAGRAARAAFGRIAVLDSLLSDYREDSELSRLSAAAGGAPVRVSPELFELLSLAQRLARLSDGAFDATSGPLVRLWREARRAGRLPAPGERERAAARVGWRHLRLDPAARTAHLLRPGMRLDLGGIAKGYAADQALGELRRHGVARALVELGGDIVAGAPPPGRRGWRVEVADAGPGFGPLLLRDAAVSTSGDAEQFLEVDGERYSHVVDPATGEGLRGRVAATVVAPDGATADALSTLLGVLGPERGPAWAARHFPEARVHLRRVR